MKSFSALAVTAWLLLWPGPFGARLNLPQIEAHAKLGAKSAAAARDYFRREPRQESLPAWLDQALVESLPQEFAPACREIIENWGEEAKGSDRWTVRLLDLDGGNAWLAFRCGSRLPVYHKNYDERLALLHLGDGSLDFIPLGPNLENDSALYHLNYDGRLPLRDAKSTALRVRLSAENPCCDGPEMISEEKLLVLAETLQGIRQAFYLLTHREHYSHNDVDGDTNTVYDAKMEFARDAAGRVVSVIVRFREETQAYDVDGHLRRDQPAPRTGKLIYRWNPATFTFAAAP